MNSIDQLKTMITAHDFPCVGAKAALAHDQIEFFEAGNMASDENDTAILHALSDFAIRQPDGSLYVSFIALFSDTPKLTELEFETALWHRLQGIHNNDLQPWDPSVNDNPDAPDFSMSIGGNGFYVVGLHPDSSRMARRAAVPTLVFNLHRQFETLRHNGQYERMQKIIRDRDIALSGSINPMLASFGESSEALQYSGRKVDKNWTCPFHHHATAS